MPHEILCMPARTMTQHAILDELALTLREDAALTIILDDLEVLLDRGELQMARRELAAARALQADILNRRRYHMEQARRVLSSGIALVVTCVSVLASA